MVESADKSPCSGPSESLQIKIADVIEDVIIVPSYTSNDEQLVFVENSCVSSSAFRNWTVDSRLCPMCGFQVEDDEIGQVGSVFILAPKNEQFVSLVEGSSVAYIVSFELQLWGSRSFTHSNPRNIAKVVDQRPLVGD